MMKLNGPLFNQCLLMILDTIWHQDRQPQAWQKSLIQPIFKRSGKDASDPSSYQGIYLISALAKLFEGVRVTRLTTFTLST